MLHVVAISSGSCLVYFLFVGLNLLNAVRGVKEIYVGELKWKEVSTDMERSSDRGEG